MSGHKYYDLSSDDESDGVGGHHHDDDASYYSSGDESDDDDFGMLLDDNDHDHDARNAAASQRMMSGQDPLWGRTIVHLDIDCFYVQVEEIERGLRHSGRPIPPLAIGQKHIIVTSNYLARSLGVKKLQSKREALETCPTLQIVDGSDLRQYRKHSRAVYQAFRTVMEAIYREVFQVNDPNLLTECIMKKCVPCVRGCMDEMMGELSHVVNSLVAEPDHGAAILAKLLIDIPSCNQQQKLHIFGDDPLSSVVNLVEDQTGASVTVSLSSDSSTNAKWGNGTGRQLSHSRRNVHDSHNGDRLACRRRFEVATQLGQYLCYRIQQQTQFHTTIGLSVSPMLAKLAGGLSKPNAINVLLPWRTADLMYSMPLRKMPNVGHRTMKVLDNVIREELREKPEEELICVGDLLQLPTDRIVSCLNDLHQGISSENHCDKLLKRCRGLDSTTVIDDEGGATKTVSVEDSCRRGTVRSMDLVWKYLDSFFVRLPQLLSDRLAFSPNPKLAYPATLRLTVRLLDPSLSHKRRPYVVKSKQVGINGKSLMEAANDEKKQALLLKAWVTPLVKSLLVDRRDNKTELDVTRINLAVTNFADIAAQSMASNHTLMKTATTTTKASGMSQQSQTFTRVAKKPLSNSRSKLSSPAKRQKNKAMTTTRIDQFFFKK